MQRVAHVILTSLRAWIRMLQTRRTGVAGVMKLLLTVLMLPAFAILLLILFIMSALRIPFEVQVRTDPESAGGDTFICHPPDIIQMYLWLFGIWEPDLTHFMRARLKPGDGFIDVGANIGVFTALAARCVGSSGGGSGGAGGSVLAIEASPAIFESLTETLGNNEHCQGVRAANVAASAPGAGSVTMYSGPAHNIGLTTTLQQRGLPEETTIRAEPLDQIVQPRELARARIIKIDVEGGEDAVIQGMQSIIQNGRNDLEILLELSPNWWADKTRRPIDVLKPFLDAGFHIYEMENNYWPWRYLWPNDVKRPWRCQRDLTQRVLRLDLVLSRRDVREL